MILTNWLLVLAVVSLSATSLTAMSLLYLTNVRWMRIFSEKQGIPFQSMDGKPIERDKPIVAPRMRMSVPIPGTQFFKGKTQ